MLLTARDLSLLVATSRNRFRVYMVKVAWRGKRRIGGESLYLYLYYIYRVCTIRDIISSPYKPSPFIPRASPKPSRSSSPFIPFRLLYAFFAFSTTFSYTGLTLFAYQRILSLPYKRINKMPTGSHTAPTQILLESHTKDIQNRN